MNIVIKRILIVFSILVGVGVVAYIAFVLIIANAFGVFDKDYSVTELKENFNKKQTEIYELKKYFNEIVPKNRYVEIEFKNDNTLGRFEIRALDSIFRDPNLPMISTNNAVGKPKVPMFLEWNLKINTHFIDSIVKPLGWTIETFRTLKDKLDKANCIGIGSGEPATIEFKRSGMGMYSFIVFDKAIPDSLKKNYNDSCYFILATDKLVLEYGGGAIGPQCFYNLE